MILVRRDLQAYQHSNQYDFQIHHKLVGLHIDVAKNKSRSWSLPVIPTPISTKDKPVKQLCPHIFGKVDPIPIAHI